MSTGYHAILVFLLTLLVKTSAKIGGRQSCLSQLLSADSDFNKLCNIFVNVFNLPETWFSTQDPCEWDGIFCKYDPSTNKESINTIDLSNLKLNGTINLFYEWPSQIEYLNLSNNRLMTSSDDSITFSTFSKLAIIKWIDFSNNLLFPQNKLISFDNLPYSLNKINLINNGIAHVNFGSMRKETNVTILLDTQVGCQSTEKEKNELSNDCKNNEKRLSNICHGKKDCLSTCQKCHSQNNNDNDHHYQYHLQRVLLQAPSSNNGSSSNNTRPHPTRATQESIFEQLVDPTSTAFLVMILLIVLCIICCILGFVYRYWKNLKLYQNGGQSPFKTEVSIKELSQNSPRSPDSQTSNNNNNKKPATLARSHSTYSSQLDITKDNLRMISTDEHNAGADNLGRNEFYQVNKNRGVFSDDLDDKIENESENDEDSILGKNKSINDNLNGIHNNNNDIILPSASEYELTQLNLKKQSQQQQAMGMNYNKMEMELRQHLQMQNNQNVNRQNSGKLLRLQGELDGGGDDVDDGGASMYGANSEYDGNVGIVGRSRLVSESQDDQELYAPSGATAASIAAAFDENNQNGNKKTKNKKNKSGANIQHKSESSGDSSSSDSENAKIAAMAKAVSQGTRDPRKPSAIVQSNSHKNIFDAQLNNNNKNNNNNNNNNSNNNFNINIVPSKTDNNNSNNMQFGARKNYYNVGGRGAAIPRAIGAAGFKQQSTNESLQSLPSLPRDSNISSLPSVSAVNLNAVAGSEAARDTLVDKKLPNLPRDSNFSGLSDNSSMQHMNLQNVENRNRDQFGTFGNLPQLPRGTGLINKNDLNVAMNNNNSNNSGNQFLSAQSQDTRERHETISNVPQLPPE